MIVIIELAMISCNKDNQPISTEGNNYYSVVKMKQDYTQNAMGIENKREKSCTTHNAIRPWEQVFAIEKRVLGNDIR